MARQGPAVRGVAPSYARMQYGRRVPTGRHHRQAFHSPVDRAGGRSGGACPRSEAYDSAAHSAVLLRRTCGRRPGDVVTPEDGWEREWPPQIVEHPDWQPQGQRAEAYTWPARIYGWFTEGFDTADLQAAKALLEALS
jgi:hypothetical protein